MMGDEGKWGERASSSQDPYLPTCPLTSTTLIRRPSHMAQQTPPRTLATLPNDVLYEILGYVLSDLSDIKRVSILRVCRSLHDAAGVHLYRTVHAKSLASWKLLFGSPGGLLTVEGERDLGRHVRELQLGAREVDWQDGRCTCTPPSFFSYVPTDLPTLVH